MATDSKTAADGVLEDHGDGKITLHYERHFDHPIERVWAALTETAEMVAWWGDADVGLVEGGKFTVRWLNTDDEGNTAVMNARITELDPPNLLETDATPTGCCAGSCDRSARGPRSPSPAPSSCPTRIRGLTTCLAGRSTSSTSPMPSRTARSIGPTGTVTTGPAGGSSKRPTE
jgi:hypothetical protein